MPRTMLGELDPLLSALHTLGRTTFKLVATLLVADRWTDSGTDKQTNSSIAYTALHYVERPKMIQQQTHRESLKLCERRSTFIVVGNDRHITTTLTQHSRVPSLCQYRTCLSVTVSCTPE